MTHRFCPQCGQARTGSFRFCRNCAFDYDSLGTPAAAEPPDQAQPTQPPAPQVAPGTTPDWVRERRAGSRWRTIGGTILMTVVFLIVVGVARELILSANGLGSSDGDVGDADVPPTGVVWFGESFDTGTFAIRTRITTVGTNDEFVLVAHLRQSVDASDLAIRISFDGSLVTTTSINSTDNGDVWGVQGGPLFEAGAWKYEFTDIGGNVLASGQITTTE